jgi:2-polyprenyl-3-methyl-5-hydroxy-6-metoxy-1,4-benzoquinol methylase
MTESYDLNYRNAENATLELEYSNSRQRAAAKCIFENQSKTVLEIGCALNPISNYISNTGSDIEKLDILEPNEYFYKSLPDFSTADLVVTAHNLSLEEYASKTSVEAWKHDFIVVNCLLQEINNPHDFLSLIREISSPAGKIWVSVPNANSIHKVIAREHSEFQAASFGRKWSFDKDSLSELITRVGGSVILEQTRILKPVNDAIILDLIRTKPDFFHNFQNWVDFQSTSIFYGAELDVLFEFN